MLCKLIVSVAGLSNRDEYGWDGSRAVPLSLLKNIFSWGRPRTNQYRLAGRRQEEKTRKKICSLIWIGDDAKLPPTSGPFVRPSE